MNYLLEFCDEQISKFQETKNLSLTIMEQWRVLIDQGTMEGFN